MYRYSAVNHADRVNNSKNRVHRRECYDTVCVVPLDDVPVITRSQPRPFVSVTGTIVYDDGITTIVEKD